MALAVAVSALLTLALEVFSTRLFAVLLWKNAAAAILSLALLGIGVSGALVYLRPAWFPRERRHSQVAWALVAFGVSIVASYLMLLALSRAPRSEMEPLSHFVPLVLAGMLPFGVGGLVLTIVFTHEADLPRLYRIDLVSAAVGAVLVLPALSALNGPPLVPALAAVAALGALVLAHRERLRGPRNAAVGLLVALGALSVFHAKTGVLRVTHSHGTADGPIELERWGPLARMTVRPHSGASKWLDIDSQVVTAVLRFSGDPADVDYLRRSVLQLAYHLRPFERVLVIGPGGGSDVLAALTSGAKDITAVEVNPTTVGIMRGELSSYTGGLYDRPEVHVHVADGRAHVAAMRERVDLLQATFVDTFTAQASGAHTLSENYLYTVEGFGDFLDHLREGGVLSMSRWGGEAYTFAEVHRSVAIARDALDRRGVKNPGDHVVVVQGAPPEKLTLGGGYLHQAGNSESMSTLLVKTSPFTAEELDRLSAAVDAASFRPLWMGGRGGPDVTLRRLLTLPDRAPVYAGYRAATGLDISPSTDDRPFFFDMLDPLRWLFRAERPEWGKHFYYWFRLLGVQVVRDLLIATLTIAALLLIVPMLGRLGDLRAVRRPAASLGYFVCLGVAFIGVELALMAQFALYLEHPTYSLVVFLASVLLWSGIGSARTARVAGDPARAAASRAGVLVAVLLALAAALPPLLRASMGLPLPVRMVVAVLVAAAPATLMGMLFPLGVAALRARGEERLVPWVWGLNSAFSVVGAVASLPLAMSFGHRAVWLIYTGVYGLAALAALRLRGRPADVSG